MAAKANSKNSWVKNLPSHPYEVYFCYEERIQQKQPTAEKKKLYQMDTQRNTTSYLYRNMLGVRSI